MGRLFLTLPKSFQKPVRAIFFSIPEYYRYGKTYRNVYNHLLESQMWSIEKIKEYQLRKIQEMVKHAYDTVPYYHKLLDAHNIKPRDIDSFKAFERIPFLTKEIVQDNLDDLISTSYSNKRLKYATTGGSTGTPMGFYVDRKLDRQTEWAYTTHIWRRAGYNPKKLNRQVLLRGIVPSNGVYEYKNKNLILSSYSLTAENINLYIKLMEEFEPDFIQAYPSSIVIIADYILNNDIKIKFKRLKSILCASENLYAFQRKIIEKAFNVRVFSFYGHSEHICIGGECEERNEYHMEYTYGYTELIKEDDSIKTDDEIGEIVGTSLNNFIMPFIRYKTGDLATKSYQKCSCGRNHLLVKKIEGREQEQLIANNGTKIAMTSILFSQHFEAFGKIRSVQLVQNEMGKVIVNLIESQKLDAQDFKEIKTKMENATNKTIEVNIKIVDTIERTKRGKHKYLVQNMNVK